MEKIRFITDSASDMNHPREDVTILPLHIRFGDDEYACLLYTSDAADE